MQSPSLWAVCHWLWRMLAETASRTGISFGEYLTLLEGLPSQELFDANPEVFYQHTVAATWNTSVAAAEQQATLARQALQMTAFLAPEGIPRSFFGVLEKDSPAGRKRVADALNALARYSLIAVAADRVSVHRLLRKVIRDQLTDHEQAKAATHALTAIRLAMPKEPGSPATWPQWQELIPHAAALRHRRGGHGQRRPKLVAVLNPMVRFQLLGQIPSPGAGAGYPGSRCFHWSQTVSPARSTRIP